MTSSVVRSLFRRTGRSLAADCSFASPSLPRPLTSLLPRRPNTYRSESITSRPARATSTENTSSPDYGSLLYSWIALSVQADSTLALDSSHVQTAASFIVTKNRVKRITLISTLTNCAKNSWSCTVTPLPCLDMKSSKIVSMEFSHIPAAMENDWMRDYLYTSITVTQVDYVVTSTCKSIWGITSDISTLYEPTPLHCLLIWPCSELYLSGSSCVKMANIAGKRGYITWVAVTGTVSVA